MKLSLFVSSLFSLGVSAFPSTWLKGDLPQRDFSPAELQQIQEVADLIARQADHKKRQLGLDILPVIGFDPVAQKVDTTGKYAYKAPGKNDIRGPCPGLNLLANHGYINRSGVDSVVQITLASNIVFGMGHDLAGFLSVYSGIFAGDLTSVSIGGPPPQGLLGGLTSGLGLLGKPLGLSKSHYRFECDFSPFREDLYLGNDPVSLNLRQFRELADMPLGPRGIDFTVLFPFRERRFDHSVANNGYFFSGPLTSIFFNTGTYIFTYRMYGNHSTEHPEGYLDLETLMAFNGVTRNSNGDFEWKSGREHIPDGWYRRAIGDDFGIPGFFKDGTQALLTSPRVYSIGGNTGKPNTFVGADLGKVTNGVFNADTLLEGNNAMCFAFSALQAAAPDIARGLVGNVLLAVNKLAEVLNPVIATLGCPQLAKYDDSSFGQYPGWYKGAI